MYGKPELSFITASEFVLLSQIQLDENNPWVIQANLIPWGECELDYANIFDDKLGAPAKTFRMALGALIIQQKLKLTDREEDEEKDEEKDKEKSNWGALFLESGH